MPKMRCRSRWCSFWPGLRGTLNLDTDGDSVLDATVATSYQCNLYSPRHGNGAANCLFAGGSVKRRTLVHWMEDDNQMIGDGTRP